MFLKIILNILINLAIFTMLMCLIWAFNQAYYPIMVGAAVILALFIYFKIRMIKSVRALYKKKLT